MDLLQSTALAAGLAWASGIRLYGAVFLIGLLARYDVITLPSGLALLQDDWVLWVSGILMVGEFLADKVPAFDSVWDALHTFIRIPAGGLLAWGVFQDSSPGLQLAAGLLGGVITSGTHLTKAGTRALINTSPEPFSNWGASVGEDLSVLGGLYLVWHYPWVFLGLLLLFGLVMIWVLPKLWRVLRRVWQRLRNKPAALPATG
ncbi:uncharacterized protein DUF4126 [Tahibacter aquaticus]|uniref:Uncharacterized protein DUF4126 n=1 Tax=Tahibacter aquaticus TaxID=520092 RepID=A0A4R6Z6R4_9GAMM|nr:DUF4126 domain-containing protein [Tahibacter aquaticus]TDR47468.1 uncharacterized protein DUF4126 [Tahibacter aquaticus]